MLGFLLIFFFTEMRASFVSFFLFHANTRAGHSQSAINKLSFVRFFRKSSRPYVTCHFLVVSQQDRRKFIHSCCQHVGFSPMGITTSIVLLPLVFASSVSVSLFLGGGYVYFCCRLKLLTAVEGYWRYFSPFCSHSRMEEALPSIYIYRNGFSWEDNNDNNVNK